MKFTNVKQLIIKFMGGGLINFPTRFLRWVKINGDTEDDGDSDDGGGSEGSLDINTILDNISIKDDLLTKLQAIDYTNQGDEGVLTDLTFDDVFNDYNDFIKSCLYRETVPCINIIFPEGIALRKDDINKSSFEISNGNYGNYYVFIINNNNNFEISVIKEYNPLM